MKSLDELTVPKIDQGGPPRGGAFAYVDISSIDNQSKRIVELKHIPTDEAPSRAKQRLHTGDVLVSMTRPNLNAVALVSHELNGAIGSTGFHVLRAAETVLPQWLYYGVQSQRFIKEMSALVQGALYPAVRPKDIRRFQLPTPKLDDQRRIVAEIEKQFSRLDQAVASLQRVKAQLKRYKASVLKAAVEGRLVETEAERARREGRSFETGAELAAPGRANAAGGRKPGAALPYETGEQLLKRILETRRSQWKGRGKYKEPAAPDTSGLPELPEGWVWAAIAQVAVVASGNTPSGILNAVKQEGDVPWFKVGDMNHGENQRVMRHADAWLSSDEVGGFGMRLFSPNTVLFPKRGGAIATNKKRRLESSACADLNVMGITPEQQLAAYFFAWFDSVDLSSLSDGSNVPQINHNDIEPLVIPLPPLPEQHRIVAEVDRRLSIVREVEAEVGANLKRAQALRQSVLTRAFAGDAG